MYRFFLNTFASLLIFFTLSINMGFALSDSERAEVEGVIHNYAEAWNERACVGFANDFSADADFVNIYGMHFSGREEIESRHVRIMQSFLKDSKLKIENIKLREIHPGLIIALVHWSLDGFHRMGSDLSEPGKTRKGLFTHVFLHNKKWEIVASQNTLKLK